MAPTAAPPRAVARPGGSFSSSRCTLPFRPAAISLIRASDIRLASTPNPRYRGSSSGERTS